MVQRSLAPVYERTVAALNESYARNGLNQYTSVAGTAFTHDARGNLTGDGARSFQYDLENRLTSVTGAASGEIIYDPLGRVRSYTGSGVETHFLYDGDRLIAEYNGAGALQRRYVHGPGVDEPLVWYEGADASSPRWLIADRQGSIIATTNASGAASPLAYGPYGEPSAWSGAGGAMLSRFRYTGQAALPELQLYHYKARVYDPRLGRFLQTDPIGYEDDLNLYAYVGNDPGNKADPSGRQIEAAGNWLKWMLASPQQKAEQPTIGQGPGAPRNPFAPAPDIKAPEGTVQVGVTGQVTTPGGAQVQGSVGVAVSTKPDVGLYGTGAVGPTSDKDGSTSFGVEVVLSNAASVENLAGTGGAASYTVGDGQEGVTLAVGRSADGSVVSGGIAVSTGVSREPSVGVSRTETAVVTVKTQREERKK
jgi:RHS repeat-associated protein